MPENRVLAGELISRAQVEGMSPTEGDIEAALAALDHELAARCALARARAHAVPTGLIARILPGIELPAITCALVAIAPEKAGLLDVIESRAFPQTKEASELEAIVLYAVWKAGAPEARIKPELRRLAARSMTAEGYALLATIAASIDDPNVAAACKPIASFATEYKKQVAQDDAAMHASIDKVIAALPAEVEQSRGGFTVRAAKQAGRNDPCPCGSGLKFKKCCADKPVATPSPIPGVAWEDFLHSPQMTGEHVKELAPRDLAKVDLGVLAEPALTAALRRFLALRAWDRANQVVEQFIARIADKADAARSEVALALLDVGDVERARPLIAAMTDKHLYELELAIHDAREPWQALLAAVDRCVASKDKLDDVDLAYALLRARPALGIYFARACIGTLHVDDADLLLEYVEDARDKLGLPPTDPAWDILDTLRAGVKGGRRRAAEPATNTELHDARARIGDLERTIDTLRTELADVRTRPAAELVRARDNESPLEARVRELEGLIREGNAERAELRKQLQKAEPAPPPRESLRRPHEEEAPDEGDELPLGTRGITLPRFDRRFADALADVPVPVAAEALRTVGILASGDGFAWRQVKQAKDMARQVLMARVGIHHRMLFRVDEGTMDVIDLITREQLLTTLKRLRAQR
jgi:uncharacterized protein YchJ